MLAKEMQKQGLNAVQQLPNGYDQDFVANNADVLEGSIVVPQFVAFEVQPQIPEIKTFLEWMEKIGKAPVEVAASGWILADEFVHGLKLAGPEFTQKKVIDGLNTVTDYSDNGFIVPIDWTKPHNDPVTHPECARSARVRELHAGEERQVRRRSGDSPGSRGSASRTTRRSSSHPRT